jgi:hypothetical protein
MLMTLWEYQRPGGFWSVSASVAAMVSGQWCFHGDGHDFQKARRPESSGMISTQTPIGSRRITALGRNHSCVGILLPRKLKAL